MCDCGNCRKKKADTAFKTLETQLKSEKGNMEVLISVPKTDLQVLINRIKELEDAR